MPRRCRTRRLLGKSLDDDAPPSPPPDRVAACGNGPMRRANSGCATQTAAVCPPWPPPRRSAPQAGSRSPRATAPHDGLPLLPSSSPLLPDSASPWYSRAATTAWLGCRVRRPDDRPGWPAGRRRAHRDRHRDRPSCRPAHRRTADPANRELYEVWFVATDDSPATPHRISAGTFHPDPDGHSDVQFTAAVNPALFPIVEITAEPGDGNPVATGPSRPPRRDLDAAIVVTSLLRNHGDVVGGRCINIDTHFAVQPALRCDCKGTTNETQVAALHGDRRGATALNFVPAAAESPALAPPGSEVCPAPVDPPTTTEPPTTTTQPPTTTTELPTTTTELPTTTEPSTTTPSHRRRPSRRRLSNRPKLTSSTTLQWPKRTTPHTGRSGGHLHPTTAAPQGLRNGRVPTPEAEAVDAFILEFDITFNEFGSMRVTWAGKGNACTVDKLVLYQSREFGKNVFLALVDARVLELRRGCSVAVTIDGRRTTDTPVVGLTQNGLYVYFERTRRGQCQG